MTQANSSRGAHLTLRFRDARPGWELIAVVNAAIPITRLTANVLAQDRKRLPPLDEFVLRLVDAGVATTEELAGCLGLPDAIVVDAVAAQFSSDNVSYRRAAGPGRTLELTARGKAASREPVAVTPVEVDLPLAFDRLIWRVRPYDDNQTISRNDAQRDDILVLPERRTDVVDTADVSSAEINAILRDQGVTDREVLAVKTVRQRPARRLMPANLLVYADAAREDVRLAVVVDDELIDDHETALLELGGAERYLSEIAQNRFTI